MDLTPFRQRLFCFKRWCQIGLLVKRRNSNLRKAIEEDAVIADAITATTTDRA